MSDKPTGLNFPCTFPIKIMGWANQSLEESVLGVLNKYVEDFTSQQLSSRPSKGGKYVAITATFEALSQQQLDNIYQELSGHADVLMVL